MQRASIYFTLALLTAAPLRAELGLAGPQATQNLAQRMLDERRDPKNPRFITPSIANETVMEVARQLRRENPNVSIDLALLQAQSAVRSLEDVKYPCDPPPPGEPKEETCPMGDINLKSINESSGEMRAELQRLEDKAVAKAGPEVATPGGPDPGMPVPMDSFSSAPTLGPLLGTGSTGSVSTGPAGHRDEAPTPTPSRPEPVAQKTEENIQAVRQALHERMVSGEITPQTAENILSQVTPALRSEPDLATALEQASAGFSMNQPKAATTDDKPAVVKAKTSAAKLEAPAPKQLPSADDLEIAPAPKSPVPTAAEAAKPGQIVMSLFGNSAALPSLPKSSAASDALASSIADAIAQKNAPLPTDAAGDGASTASAGSGPTEKGSNTQLLATTGLFNGAGVKTQAVKLAGATIDKLVQKMQTRDATRIPASESKQDTTELSPEAILTLASLKAGMDDVPSVDEPWLPLVCFLAAFSLTLFLCALWNWYRRRAHL